MLQSFSASQKKNHMGFELNQQSLTFLFLKKEISPTNLPLYHCLKLLLTVCHSKKNNKIPSVFSWALSPARQKTSALKYHMSQISPPVTCPSDTAFISNSTLGCRCSQTTNLLKLAFPQPRPLSLKISGLLSFIL